MTKKPNNFEKSLEALEDILQKLDKGDLPLESTIEYFEKGMQLAATCESILNNAQKKLDDIK